MVTIFKHRSSQKRGEFVILFAFQRQYISLVTILKNKKEKKKKTSTKSYTLAGSLENMPVIQARHTVLSLKGMLSLFCLFLSKGGI